MPHVGFMIGGLLDLQPIRSTLILRFETSIAEQHADYNFTLQGR